MIAGLFDRSYTLDRTKKVRCIVEDPETGKFEILDGETNQNPNDYILIKDLKDIGTQLGLEGERLPSSINKDFTNVLKFKGYCKRSENHNHKSAVFQYGPYTLKDIHSIYRTTQRYIPESLVWNVFRDIVRAGGNLEVSKLWHPGINLNNIVFRGAKERFKLSNPFIHDSFLRRHARVQDGLSDEFLEDEINKNVKQVGLSLLSLTSLAEFKELR